MRSQEDDGARVFRKGSDVIRKIFRLVSGTPVRSILKRKNFVRQNMFIETLTAEERRVAQ